nr:bifunctional phosphopantothenoylcysteine decarboxylase/phosphopantothenate--cysteine ligase CoaBC [Bacteroidales bacterium]
LFLIAPVSANTLAKMANGIADNLLMTTYLAARCPVFFAPAMDLDMFNHPATQKNIEVIRTFGHCLIESREGELASGLTGPGRMEEPERIFEIIHECFYSEARFENFNVLITAGPTYENIDPVRFLGNYSSGKMGFAIAKAMSENGAKVTLISGPVHLATPAGSIKRIDVISSEEMYEACMKEADNSDIIIMAAAVADFRVENYQGSKIKKSGDTFSLKFVQTPDILRSLGQRKKHEQIIVGFALETDNELDNAKAKLQNKNIDIIVLNSLRHKGAGFATDTNKITILDRNETIREYEMKSKSKVADDIVAYISDFLKQKK